MANPGVVLARFLLCLGQLGTSPSSQPAGAPSEHLLTMLGKKPLPGETRAARSSVPANSSFWEALFFGRAQGKAPTPSRSSATSTEPLPDLLLVFSPRGQEKKDVQVSLAGDSRLPITDTFHDFHAALASQAG